MPATILTFNISGTGYPNSAWQQLMCTGNGPLCVPPSLSLLASMPAREGFQPHRHAGLVFWLTPCTFRAQPACASQVLRFYERLGLKLPQQPPLLLVKSAELGNAASREQHPSSDRGAPGSNGAAPVMHTR